MSPVISGTTAIANLRSRRSTSFILENRYALSLVLILLGALAATGMTKLVFDGNYRVFFGAENPELLEFNAFQKIYTRNDNLFFILHDRDAAGFSRKLAKASELVTERAWKLPFASRVDSVNNYQHSYAEGEDSLVVEDLFRDVDALSEAEIARRGAIALNEPTLAGNIVSPDGTTVIVSVTMPFPEKDPSEIPAAAAAAREIVTATEAAFPNLRIALSGTTMFNNAFNEAGAADSETLIPMTYLAMLVLIVVLLRSLSGALATLIVISLATVTALGLAGHLGISMMPIAIAAPTIILTLAVADSVHLIAAVKRALLAGLSKREAVESALDSNAAAIMLTSVTTAIGFLSMNLSDSPPFRVLGTITAIGVLAAWLYSIVLVPTFLLLMPLRPAKSPKLGLVERSLEAYAGLVIRHRRPVLAAGGTISLVFAGLAFTNLNSDRFPDYFDWRMPFRSDLEFGIEKIKSADLFEVSVSSGKAEGINDPAYLKQLDDFASWLREDERVRHVYSYTDLIKRLNMNMHDDDPEWRRLPDSPELAAQYLLLYELSLPYGLDLNDRISVDKSATRVSVSLTDMTSQEIRQLSREVQQWFIDATPSNLEPARPTGPSVMFSFISKRNVDAMVSGTVIAVVLVALAIMIGLRSVKFGLVSLIPNLLPALIAFGIWSILVGKVGMAASVIGATSLGIVVDDSIHFIAKYLQARREDGATPEEAVRTAFTRVGGAILATTVIVTAGFAILATSVFAVNAQLGLLTAITILVALVFDFTLLPALLLSAAKRDAHKV